MSRPLDSVTAVFISHRCESDLGRLTHVDELKDCCCGDTVSIVILRFFSLLKMLLDSHWV